VKYSRKLLILINTDNYLLQIKNRPAFKGGFSFTVIAVNLQPQGLTLLPSPIEREAKQRISLQLCGDASTIEINLTILT
jgi:hypothetical protein